MTGHVTGRWYVAGVQPRRERLATEHLCRQGFEVFAPNFERTVRHARQFRNVSAPLFPGYVFVRLQLEQQRWRAVNGTRGVRGLITSGGRPAPVPVSVMAELLGADAGVAPMRPGEIVEIVAGPLAGLKGVLISLQGSERVRVLLELVGGGVASSLPLANVRRAA